MNFKRLAILICLLFCITTGASASLASLDDALSPLLAGEGTVRFSATLTLNTLPPFDDIRIDLFNRVLQHTQLAMQVSTAEKTQTTSFQLSIGDTELLSMTEQNQGGAYLLQTSLLPSRMLFSTQASPMDILLSSGEEAVQPEEDTGLNTSDVETAFDMLTAVNELEDCYRTLIDQTVPLTEKNTPNYSIENIGRGRISYVAKLTEEQLADLQDEIRTVISCGMDEEYRQELAQVSFASGFTVALYQNADAEDICVYIRGTMIYPDGDTRTLKWQWAFTPDRETQTFLHEAARESGTRDSRVIESILTRTEDDASYTMEEKTTTNLRRSSLNETSTLTVDLRGDIGDATTCFGNVKRVTKATLGGEDAGSAQTDVTVDLALNNTDDGAWLSGTASYREETDNNVQAEFALTFAPLAAPADETAEAAEAEESTPNVVISLSDVDPAVAAQTAETPTVTAKETQTEQPEFLVGAAPLGLVDYDVPQELITVNMDTTEQKIHQSLMNEATQLLAGKLLLAILDLPAEDRLLLSDGMTDSDYAIFLAMLD